jgi:hypothetical protein
VPLLLVPSLFFKKKKDRPHFKDATRGCPPAAAVGLWASVLAVGRSLCSGAALSRALDLALFPLADLLLFVAPTFHAHATMALNAESFVYEVAPKGNSASDQRALAKPHAAAAVQLPPLGAAKGARGELSPLLAAPVQPATASGYGSTSGGGSGGGVVVEAAAVPTGLLSVRVVA